MFPQNLTIKSANSEDGAPREYRLLHESSGFVKRGGAFLELRGTEAIEFLHRLSTNDLRSLGPGKSRPTILTNEKGRMVDLLHVLRLSDKVLLILGGEAADRVKSWLDKYIIMEEITTHDVSRYYERVSILGPKAASVVAHLTQIDASGLGESVVPLTDHPQLLLYCNSEWPIPAYEVVGPPKDIATLPAYLRDNSNVGLISGQVSAETLNVLRIESGVPAPGTEINEEANPLEAGLSRFVSFTKGCYIGQEVIARLDTYKKLQRRLKGIIFPKGIGVSQPGKLRYQGSDAGWTTSHAYSFTMGRDIALGYLKMIPDLTEVDFLDAGGGGTLHAEVVDLPFCKAFPEQGPGS
jgi:folate-binding protein YgfZ